MSMQTDDKCLNKAGQDPSAGNEQETLSSMLKLFFHHQLTLKMSHFSTDSYAIGY